MVTLELKVTDDDIPEEAETFVVTLLPPDKASLGLITQRTIVIERNDAPYGLLQVFPAGTRYVTRRTEQHIYRLVNTANKLGVGYRVTIRDFKLIEL